MRTTTGKGSPLKKVKRFDHHHIVPSSRGGSYDPENLAKVEKRRHAVYHMLFVNRTPNEIITWLVEYFWNGQWDWVERALENNREH
jgi:hypothetical protein